mgnify:FL=1
MAKVAAKKGKFTSQFFSLVHAGGSDGLHIWVHRLGMIHPMESWSMGAIPVGATDLLPAASVSDFPILNTFKWARIQIIKETLINLLIL